MINASPLIPYLASLITTHQKEIEVWFEEAYASHPPLFYTSVDLRHSGSKLAPVDTNIYPAGFNHLSSRGKSLAIKEASAFLDRYFPEVTTIALVIEDHTRNVRYLENVSCLFEILEATQRKCVLSYTSHLPSENVIETITNKKIPLTSLHQKEHSLVTAQQEIIDLVILNNDLATGLPALFEGINTPIVPSPRLGWYVRKKSHHFTLYQQTLQQFVNRFGGDTFLMNAQYRHCGHVRFREKQGLECIAEAVDDLARELHPLYQQYGISYSPYFFIKSDNGTYGMGIMTASSGKEIIEMNKKRRHSMDTGKGGVLTSEVIIQEGIPTQEQWDHSPAEPMVYLVNGQVVDCILRVNTDKDAFGNLNSKGMNFLPYPEAFFASETFQVFSLIARLAALAASKEHYETLNT